MTQKSIILRHLANEDIENAMDYYLTISTELANNFVTDLENSLMHIGQFPSAGSTRYAYELNIPELRYWMLKDYPYIVFYIEYCEHIDVWRVLHAKTDIPNWLN